MDVVDLKVKYPNIIKFCQEHDCNFKEAMRLIDEKKKKGKLNGYV